MPPIQRYEWICLRALKSGQCRSYTTSQTSTPDEKSQNSSPPPISPTADTAATTQCTRTPDHIRRYLEEQDTIALSNLKTKVQQIQTNAALAESLLSSFRASTSTVQLIPSIPRFNVVRSYNSRNITESRAVTQTLHNRGQVVLDNIWDLENIQYPYEKGPSVAEKYELEVKALVKKGVKKEIEAERTDMRNRVDVYQKRFAQKAEALRGMVADMRRSMGLDARGGSTGTGSVVGAFAGQKRVEVVEERRNPFARKEEVREVAASAGEATIGAAKVEAEADALNPVSTTEAAPESADTIGTAKIEAEAEEAKVEATAHDELKPSSYTPMTANPAMPSTEPETAAAKPPTKPPKTANSSVSSAKKAHPHNPPAKVNASEDSTSSLTDQMKKLLKNLQAEAVQKREEVGFDKKATQIEEKKDVDEKRENPFAW